MVTGVDRLRKGAVGSRSWNMGLLVKHENVRAVPPDNDLL